MAKALGADIKNCWVNFWPEGWFVEDEDESLFGPEGEPILDDEVQYDLSRFGFIQPNEPKEGEEGMTFEAFFKKWWRQQNLATIVITVPKDKANLVFTEIRMMYPDCKVTKNIS